jgi:phage terminase large subunit-like protein
VGGWIRIRSDFAAVLQSCYFDAAKAEHFRTFCRSLIRNFDGQWAGKPFELFDWQWRDVVGPLFGWMTAEGKRRFRRAYVTVAKNAGNLRPPQCRVELTKKLLHRLPPGSAQRG